MIWKYDLTRRCFLRFQLEKIHLSPTDPTLTNFFWPKLPCIPFAHHFYSFSLGGQIYGKADDAPDELARTVFCFMVKCHFIGTKFLAKLIPVQSLTADFAFQCIKDTILLLAKFGATVVDFTGSPIHVLITTPEALWYTSFSVHLRLYVSTQLWSN